MALPKKLRATKIAFYDDLKGSKAQSLKALNIYKSRRYHFYKFLRSNLNLTIHTIILRRTLRKVFVRLRQF
jgi:hypothetical protein